MDNDNGQSFEPNPDTGDAIEASAAIERWLEQRPDSGDDDVLDAMRRSLGVIAETALVRGDTAAREIMDDMARSETMEELAAALDRLDNRIQAVLHGEATKPVVVDEAPSRSRPARTLLRL